VIHNYLRARFESKEPAVLKAMERFAELTVDARAAIEHRDWDRLGRLIDANFDVRRSICKLPAEQIEMVECVRAAGAAAKFAGSGGAIIGTCDEKTFEQLQHDLSKINSRVIRPVVE